MTKDRLPYEDFVPYAPDVPGEQVHIHHCRSGKDNDRLYIRRTEDGFVVAYCHHCGLSGFYRDKTTTSKRSKSKATGVGRTEITLPRDFTTDTKEWNPRARAWVRRYGITDDELRTNNVGYSEWLGGVVFPVFGTEGSLVCYQYRPIVREPARPTAEDQESQGKGTPPKYISRRRPDVKGGSVVFRASPSWDSTTSDADTPDCAVIVEDVLSAIKVSRVPRNTGVALMGSSLKEEQAVKISKLAPNVIVFLDNDNEQVRTNQKKAAKLMEPLVPGVVQLVETAADPKDYSTEQLKELLQLQL